MISELTDDEILEFLMTSDFEENYKPSELKYLLVKFRYFYRILYSRNQNTQHDLDFIINKMNEEIDILKSQIFNEQIENANKQNIIDSLKNRKLTIKERITGKINSNDEN
jgi:hypothetical protein